MTLREAALQYASWGFAVFPLRPRTKIPATTNGCKDATKDPIQIKTWWDDNPKFNIGIATGSKSNGLFVIDLDVDEEKGINGYHVLAEWEKQHRPLPETAQSITGRGGYHLLYRDCTSIKNAVGIYEGVDIRGEGGYIVAPPSIHPNGNEYVWEHEIEEFPIIDANNTVFEFILPPRKLEKEQFSGGGDILQGSRTSTLVKAIASMKGKSFPDASIEAAIRSMNESSCIPPLSDKELEREVLPAIHNLKNGNPEYSVTNDGFGGFGGFGGFEGFEGFEGFVSFAEPDKNDNPDFDSYWLPYVLKRFTANVAESIQVPVDMVGVFVIGVASIGVQGKFSIQPKDEWIENLNLFLSIIAESSERKTPVATECTRPIYRYEKEENERRAPEIAESIARKEVLTRQMDNIKKISGKKKNEIDTETVISEMAGYQMDINALEEVFPYVAIADDITQEALARLMNENEGILSIVSTEGGLFSMMNGRYKNSSDYDIYLKSYSGTEPVRIHRVGRPDIFIEHPILSIILAVQPIVIENIMNNDEMNGKGLNARFLYATPKSRVGNRRYEVKKMEQKVIDDYMDTIYRLMSITKKEKPSVICLSHGANKKAESFFYEIEDILKNEYEGPLKTWIGKLHGQTMRIAGVLHCVEYIEQADKVLLEESTMNNAIEIGKYFLAHARYIFKKSGLSDTQAEKDAKYILQRIEGHSKPSKPSKPMIKRDLCQICKDKKGFEKVEGLTDGLNELINRGYIRIVKQKNPNGGRPTEIIEFNPEYLDTLK